jgi:ABC-type bacteriocin/lantibiotic exporter with double-glycine peptidase domain
MWMMFASQALIGVIIAFVYSWNLTLVLIAISPLMGVGSVLQMRILAQGAQSQAGAFERATNLAIEVISGFSTVASFGWMPQAEEKFTALIGETRKPRIKAAHLAGLAWGGQRNIFVFLFVILIWF